MTKTHLAEYTKCAYCGGTGGDVDDNSVFGWHLSNSNVDLFITELGAQVAPVRFYNDTETPVMPYYISPWQSEKIDLDEPVLWPLRGNFFCMPFGGNGSEYQGEKHRAHGEPAGARWKNIEIKAFDDKLVMTMEMHTEVRPGRVTRNISLVEGHNAIYTNHRLEGYSGFMPVGYHAILRIPEQAESVLVSTSKFDLGLTHPKYFCDPMTREYQSVDYNREFSDLKHVPLLWKDPEYGDFSVFPQRPGFCDLFSLLKKDHGVPGWTTAVYPREGFLWFALKDTAVLPNTIFWIENHGRHQAPWSGRNSCLGIEDVCAYFAYGLKESAEPNALNDKGFPTGLTLSPEHVTQVNYIEGVVRIGAGFDRVAEVIFEPGAAIFISESGERAVAPLDISFLNPEFI